MFKQKPWRILHSESSKGWGGQEMRVLTEMEWMRSQGCRVVLLTPPDGILAEKAKAVGIPVLPMGTIKPLLPFYVLATAGWMLLNRIRIVSTHSSYDGWVAGIAARLVFIPLLIRYRHIEVDYPNLFLSRIAYRYLPRVVITTSQKIADRLSNELGVPKKRLLCVATGVDLNQFQSDKEGTLHQELNLPAGTLIVGMISVLRSWKGHAVLLEAWKLLLEKNPELPVHLVVAGDGPGREELAEKAANHPFKDKITLLGHRTDVPNVLASLAVLTLPSTAHEGIPQIILQAQTMQRAIVASDIGGIPEVVTDEKTGLLFPVGDSASLAEKIARLIGSPSLREQLGAAARAQILAEHTLDSMGKRLLGLYDEYIG